MEGDQLVDGYQLPSDVLFFLSIIAPAGILVSRWLGQKQPRALSACAYRIGLVLVFGRNGVGLHSANVSHRTYFWQEA